MAENASENLVLRAGMKFDRFEAWNAALVKWEKENFTQLYVRSSRSIEAGRKRTPKKPLANRLQYFEINMHAFTEEEISEVGQKAKDQSKSELAFSHSNEVSLQFAQDIFARLPILHQAERFH